MITTTTTTSKATTHTAIRGPTMVATVGAAGMVTRVFSVVILIVKFHISRFTIKSYQLVTK